MPLAYGKSVKFSLGFKSTCGELLAPAGWVRKAGGWVGVGRWVDWVGRQMM